MTDINNCILCEKNSKNIIYQNDVYHILLVEDKYYPGYVQLVINDHIKELTDVNHAIAHQIFDAILKLERMIRDVFSPDKLNIASLGNMVPHLHFHIIPRFKSDRHFPNPIWGQVTHNEYTPLPNITNKNTQLIHQIKLIFQEK